MKTSNLILNDSNGEVGAELSVAHLIEGFPDQVQRLDYHQKTK